MDSVVDYPNQKNHSVWVKVLFQKLAPCVGFIINFIPKNFKL